MPYFRGFFATFVFKAYTYYNYINEENTILAALGGGNHGA